MKPSTKCENLNSSLGFYASSGFLLTIHTQNLTLTNLAEDQIEYFLTFSVNPGIYSRRHKR